ncbi:MAG: FKBP-type peptidyl-prolyl cis-trans isomerase [Ignavibacteriaceae bacterium]|nr:FKBP-type peptidyl-prolyl cis-trans isomerase [Ignavibacteriaceae bacterium]
MKYIVFVLLVIGFIGCSKDADVVKLESGVEYANDSLGTGREAKIGDLVSVHFRAWIITDSNNLYKDWSKDSTRQMSTIGNSFDFGQPIKFKLGDSAFIKGVDEGIVGMKAGGYRTIIIPSNKAYGELGFGPVPPNSNLKVYIKLVDVKDAIVAKQWQIDTTKLVSTKSGLKYSILQPGTEEKADSTDLVVVHYSGFLTNGKVFDSSVEREEPFKFRLKLQPVIPGLEEGIKLLGKGGKAKFIIPPALGYGENPVGIIPPNSTLIFDLEVIDIQKMNTSHK